MLGDQLQFDDSLSHEFENLPFSIPSEKRELPLRSTVSFDVVLLPASTSQRRSHTLKGKTKNISQGGCGVLTESPPLVGDFYRFSTPNETDSPVDGIVARCVRCQLIDEELFESGYQFVSELSSDMNGFSDASDSARELM